MGGLVLFFLAETLTPNPSPRGRGGLKAPSPFGRGLG
jgi:hypothetical protein